MPNGCVRMDDNQIELTSFSKALTDRFGCSDVEIRNNLLALTTDAKTYLELATHLKEHGFLRCLTVTAIDWVDQREFEVYFLVHHLTINVYVKAATRIPRSRPKLSSLSSVWESAAMHEREMWELFGIEFDGNPMLKPLFLEDWTGKPPLCKDFNWRDYVTEEYYPGGRK